MYVQCTYNYDKKNTKQTNNKYTLKHKNTHKIYTKNQRKTTKKNSAEIFPCYCVDNNKISKIVYISFVRYMCSINSKVYMLKYAVTTISI